MQSLENVTLKRFMTLSKPWGCGPQPCLILGDFSFPLSITQYHSMSNIFVVTKREVQFTPDKQFVIDS